MSALRAAVIELCTAVVATAGAAAQAPFYQGKRLTVLVNYAAGGPADVEARLFAKYIGRHIAGAPGVIVQNIDGAPRRPCGAAADARLHRRLHQDGEQVTFSLPPCGEGRGGGRRHGAFSTAHIGHAALLRSAVAASWASRTILAWSSAVNLPDCRRIRPSTITVSTLAGCASETIAS
jgi:hypothetical protein